MCSFPLGSRYIEVYVSRKHQMQRHMPYSKQVMAYSKARREYESISEDRGWRDTGGSYAEEEISESLPVMSVPQGPFVSSHMPTALREGGTAGTSDGFSLHSTELYRQGTESSRNVLESENVSSPEQHFVCMRGFPSQASAQDIINVSNRLQMKCGSVSSHANPQLIVTASGIVGF